MADPVGFLARLPWLHIDEAVALDEGAWDRLAEVMEREAEKGNPHVQVFTS